MRVSKREYKEVFDEVEEVERPSVEYRETSQDQYTSLDETVDEEGHDTGETRTMTDEKEPIVDVHDGPDLVFLRLQLTLTGNPSHYKVLCVVFVQWILSSPKIGYRRWVGVSYNSSILSFCHVIYLNQPIFHCEREVL